MEDYVQCAFFKKKTGELGDRVTKGKTMAVASG